MEFVWLVLPMQVGWNRSFIMEWAWFVVHSNSWVAAVDGM